LRLESDIGEAVTPKAQKWIERYRIEFWEGEKGRRLSTSAVQIQLSSYSFVTEFPRFLSQIGASEAWTSDLITREKLNVTEHTVCISINSEGKLNPKRVSNTSQRFPKLLMCLEPSIKKIFAMNGGGKQFRGRLLVLGDSGSGKTLLTKQLFSDVAQMQLKLEA